MALRLYTGSRDIPKDIQKATKFLQLARERAKTEEQMRETEYYQILITRLKAKEENLYFSLNSKLYDLANEGYTKAQYTYAKQLFHAIQGADFPNEEQKTHYEQLTYSYMVNAAVSGFSSAYFFLGKMHTHQIFPSIEANPQQVYNCYVEGAAKHNAYCYFELASIHQNGTDLYPQSDYLFYRYLRKSAQQGFIFSQQKLGQIYCEGNLVEKNDKLALAWFREAIRNGYFFSYIDAGQILSRGGNNVPQYQLLGFAHYLMAYRCGAIFIEPRLKEIQENLRNKGVKIPNITYIDPESMKE